MFGEEEQEEVEGWERGCSGLIRWLCLELESDTALNLLCGRCYGGAVCCLVCDG